MSTLTQWPVLLALSIALAVGMAIGIFVHISWTADDTKNMSRNLAWYRANHLTKSGATTGFGSYYLVSLDGGQNWYETKREDNQVIIIGPANPDLLAQINGFDSLIKYVEQYGSIGSRPITDEDISVLQGAGFTVTKKP